MRLIQSFCALMLIIAVVGDVQASDQTLVAAREMIDSGQFEEALRSLEDTASDKQTEADFLRAVVLTRLGRTADAETLYRELIRSNPDLPEPYNNLAVLLAGAGNYNGAVELLKTSLRTHDTYRTAWENLTRIYGRLASEAYSRALNLDVETEEPAMQLAVLSQLPEPRTVIVEVPASTPAEPPVEVAVVQEPLVTSPQQDPVDEMQEAAATPLQEPAEPIADTAVEEREEIPTEPSVSAVEEVVEEAADDSPVLPDEPAIVAPTPAELAALIEAWAEAWSAQRVDDYLAFYSSGFMPAEGTRADWEEQRRARIVAPDRIQVSVAFLDFNIQAERANVMFNQSYESNTYSDVVTKALDLARENGEWKIVREAVIP